MLEFRRGIIPTIIVIAIDNNKQKAVTTAKAVAHSVVTVQYAVKGSRKW